MKRTAITISVACSISLLAACGGGKDDSSSAAKAPTASPTTPAATGKATPNPFAVAKGKAIYNKTCIACHGEGGEGIEGLGKDWTHSTFIASHTDDELVAFLKVGRPLDDPLSDGIAIMPPKGGDPSLTDEDLRNVVAFMRTIDKAAPGVP